MLRNTSRQFEDRDDPWLNDPAKGARVGRSGDPMSRLAEDAVRILDQ